MDTRFVLQGITFIWVKTRHGRIRCIMTGLRSSKLQRPFFDPFLKVVDASRHEEARDAIIGFVAHIELEEDAIRLISGRKATRKERHDYEA